MKSYSAIFRSLHIRRKLVTRGEYEVVAEMNLTDKPCQLSDIPLGAMVASM